MQIKGISEANKPYVVDGDKVHKNLVLLWAGREKAWKMSFVSNRSVSDTEFHYWIKKMKENKQNILTLRDTRRIRKSLDDLRNKEVSQASPLLPS